MDNNRPRRRPLNQSVDGFGPPIPKRSIPNSGIKIPVKTTPQVKPINPTPISKLASGNSLLNTTIPGKIYPPSPISTPKEDTKTPFKPKKKRKILKRVGLTLLALFIAAIGYGVWDAWQLYHKLHKLNVGNLATSVGGAENILVAGSTNRCNLKVQNYQWGFCSQGVTGVNSDIIFIVHLVPSTHTVSLLSIPRDTFIPNARSGAEAFKIDAALYQGPTQLVDAVEQDFGIPIQHYVEVGFDGFVNVVNAVGGMKMNFPDPVFDSESYLNVQVAGCHELNGIEALQVVRARHLQYKPPTITTSDHFYWPQEPQSDIARIARTHEFLRVLASTVVSKGVSNPITDQKLIDAIAPQVQVDNGFSTSTMLELLHDFHAANFSSIPQLTLPVVTSDVGTYVYKGVNMGDVVFPDWQTDQPIIDQFLGATTSESTITGSTLPAPNSITLNVINGSGISAQATGVSVDLQKLGFSISATPTTSAPVNPKAQETIVYYGGTSTESDALAVASKLTGYVILSDNATMVSPGSQVTVQTGTGASVIGQTSTSATTTASATAGSSTASSSSSSSTAASTSTPLGTISSANQPLQAWDPQACSANQQIVPNNAKL